MHCGSSSILLVTFYDEGLHLQTTRISSPQMNYDQVANLERSNKAVVERLKRVEGEVEKKGEFHKNCNCNRLDWNTVVSSLGNLDQHLLLFEATRMLQQLFLFILVCPCAGVDPDYDDVPLKIEKVRKGMEVPLKSNKYFISDQ